MNKALDESGSAAYASKSTAVVRIALLVQSLWPQRPRRQHHSSSCSQCPYPSCPVACHSTCKVHDLRTSEDADLENHGFAHVFIDAVGNVLLRVLKFLLSGPLSSMQTKRAVALQTQLAGRFSTVCPNTSAHTFRTSISCIFPSIRDTFMKCWMTSASGRDCFRTLVVGRIAQRWTLPPHEPWGSTGLTSLLAPQTP